MLKLYNKDVVNNFMGQIKPVVLNVLDLSDLTFWYRGIISSNGGVPRMKAIQDPKSLAKIVEQNEVQLKIAKNTSATMQPCDTGNSQMHIRHWAKTLTNKDQASTGLEKPVCKAIQRFRDEGLLHITAQKATHMVNAIIRLPTVL